MSNKVVNLVNMSDSRLAKRNERIRSYHAAHPKTSLRSIGRIFKLSHVMIFRILKEKNGEQAEADHH